MKTKTLFGTLLGGLLLCASGASAVSVHGTVCQPGAAIAPSTSPALATYVASGTRHIGFAQGALVCPVSPSANLGTHVQWLFRVNDTNLLGSITCTGNTYDSNGNLVASQATPASGNGVSTLAVTYAFQTAPSHTHSAVCQMPPGDGTTGSEIRRIELF